MSHYKKFFLFFIACLISFAQFLHAADAGNKRKVGFFLPHLNVRGTDVALYDYAHYNETILGNTSYILYVNVGNMKEGMDDYPKTVRTKFQSRFGTRFYECANMREVDAVIEREHIDVLYNQKYGHRDENMSKVCKNVVHVVFAPWDPHGDVYATISNWLSQRAAGGGLPGIPFVPYMVKLDNTTQTLHRELNIPRGAVVFGRHGGATTFDIEIAKQAVIDMAKLHPDWYFLFLNTNRFCTLPNVIYLPGTADMVYKTKFINTCTAMIHARSEGETFGLACAEFSIQNKPVITWKGGWDQAHVEMLGDKGLYYENIDQLKAQLEYCAKNQSKIRRQKWDTYSEKYSPEAVMKIFDEVFLKTTKN